METKMASASDKNAPELRWYNRLPERLLLMTGYGMISFFIGFLLAGGPEGGGAVEPLAFLTSWATVVFFSNPYSDLTVLLFVLPLYLILILILNTLLARHGKSWLKIIPLIIHGTGGFVVISMVDPAYGFGGWLAILLGLGAFWAFISLDWWLVSNKMSGLKSRI
jgi:hypothetical protein